ncbi:ABC transporter ATP-binding protein [Candidatus Parcubacteria bacterium]|nr:ABC transporter ATP-binding protein [Candidatus Parcubacteria bacterium]
MIRIENLSFSFPESEKFALKNISLDIAKGEFVALLGPNGSGKTTLALCLCVIIPHFFHGNFQGKIFINNKDTADCQIHELAKETGVLLQDYESQLFLPTIEEEIRFQLENFGFPADEKIAELEQDAHFSHLLKKKVFSLSEGEKQKALMVAILSVDSDILILDEPTSQLDKKEREQLLETLKELNKQGKTIILITHDTCFAKHCSRFITLNSGKIVRDEESLETIDSLGVEPIDYKWGTKNNRERRIQNTKISIKDLSYEDVLNKVNLDIKNNEFVLICGANGSGKTTLVKHIIKLLKIQKGEIEIDGKALKKYSQRDIASRIGFVFQNPNHQIFRNSIEEELEFTLKLLGKENKEKEINEMLSFFDLEKYRNKSPQALSTGEKYRVAMASSLVSNPDIIILDEPLTHLDFKAKQHFIKYLAELKEKGKTIIVISHHPDYYQSLVDRIFIIKNKEVIEQ